MGEVALLDAAYCYRCRIAVVRSVCLSRVGLVFTHESCAIAGIEIPTFQGLSGPSKSNGVLCVGLVFKLLSKTAEPDVSRLGEHVCVGPKNDVSDMVHIHLRERDFRRERIPGTPYTMNSSGLGARLRLGQFATNTAQQRCGLLTDE